MTKLSFLVLVGLLTSAQAKAWGRRGHQIIGESAAMLVSAEPESTFMSAKSYDFAYYNNVPDFVWKRVETYEMERHEHYMDMEIYWRALKAKPEVEKPFELSRKDFDATFPDVPYSAGRALWRIRERVTELEKVTADLRALEAPKGPERRALQERWFVIAGTLGHYVADLSQPLHASENHDGQFSGQQGIHRYFEEDCVDQLYPEIASAVYREAQKRWPRFTKQNKSKTVAELVIDLSTNSHKQLEKLLQIDKRNKRENLKKSAQAYEAMIKERLVIGSLYQAEIFRRHLGWKYDGDRFFFFATEVPFPKPGEVEAKAPTK